MSIVFGIVALISIGDNSVPRATFARGRVLWMLPDLPT